MALRHVTAGHFCGVCAADLRVGNLLRWQRNPLQCMDSLVRFVARRRSLRDGLMRVPTIVCTCLVLILSVASTEGFAQKFQEPSKEELQMTADPKAPGAPAVFLYREETTDNADHFVSEYARIKVLTELVRSGPQLKCLTQGAALRQLLRVVRSIRMGPSFRLREGLKTSW
jgi:hypothetical protein